MAMERTKKYVRGSFRAGLHNNYFKINAENTNTENTNTLRKYT